LVLDPPLATIELNRPDKHNSMNPMLHRSMHEVLTKIEEHGGIKVVVLTGAGDAFCSGMDLEECFLEPFEDPDRFSRISAMALGWFQRYKSFPAVTLARVNGWCFGGGVELVGISDLAIADQDAVFGLSEINFGVFPGGGTLWAAAHNLPRKQALYYVLTGATFTGREAVEFGLVNRAVPRVQLDDEVRGTVSLLVDKNIHTLRSAKEAYERVGFMDFAQSIEWEMAKHHELSYRSRHDWVRRALEQFHKREYRPGLEAYRLKEGE